MKKYSYIAALACLMVGAVGFASIYVTKESREKQEELAKNQQVQEGQQIEENENIPIEDTSGVLQQETLEDQIAEAELELQLEETLEKKEDTFVQEDQSTEVQTETAVQNIVEEKLSFDPEGDRMWPIEGSVLLDYSMETTIYFPTLQQYQLNPAMVLAAAVNDKVYCVAKGKITNIETNEVTGCTVTLDMGDGYSAVYGQLKELNFQLGDMVESGQVIGYISEPTKYFAVEGCSLYFQILKDDVPVDPEEILP